MRESTSSLVWTVVASLCLAAPAGAQEALSRRERAWVQHLEQRFGAVTVAERSTLEGDARTQATGLLVQAGSTSIGRYKFTSAEQAQQEVVNLLEDPHGARRRVVGEVRGDQIVVLEGPVARDPARAREALDAAWEGLPAPGQTDATFALLGPNDVALTTRLKSGPLRQLVDEVLAETRALQGQPGVRFAAPNAATVSLTSGFEAGFHANDEGASLWTAMGADRARAAQAFVEQFAPSPTPGVRGVLSRLFGG
ncbi:MAG: hypothetical protein M9894_24830 [Planctomycetes bacterium]|nr:hypothetical protein [Planctomycetota bacterium]